MEFKNKVVIVTGASRGIGKATAAMFARKGAKVVIHYNSNRAGADEVAAEIEKMGRDYLIVQADVSKMDEVRDMVNKTIDKFGRVDILVNNAGITEPKDFRDTTEEEWDRMMRINLKSVFLCCKEVVPYMEKQQYGRIINLSSIVGKTGGIGAGVHYCAAKAGVIGFSKALANQVAKDGITVNVVAPGMIDTRMISWRSPELMKKHVGQIPVGRVGKTEEVAAAICYLASDEAAFMTGQTLDINGGMYMN